MGRSSTTGWAARKLGKGEALLSVYTQSNSELIAAYLDAVIRQDASVVERFFAPDVEYVVNGTPTPDPAGVLPPISAECHAALPWLGVHRGQEAVKEFLAHMHRNLERSPRLARARSSSREIKQQRSGGSGCGHCPPGEPQIFHIRSEWNCVTV